MTPRRIFVIGLGHVGLPIAVSLAEKFSAKGFDINQILIDKLKDKIDKTNKINATCPSKAKIKFVSNIEGLKTQNFHVIAVPIPIYQAEQPDLTPLIKAIGNILKHRDTVVYESTVCSGATEEICLPIFISKCSLTPHRDFKIGYSPERINLGYKEHDFISIIKVVSGEDEDTLQTVDEKTIQSLIKQDINVKNSHVVVLGLIFKENCPDLRNTSIVDIIKELETYGVNASVCDPEASKEEALHEYGIELVDFGKLKPADAIIGAVSRKLFRQLNRDRFNSISNSKTVAIDVKNFLTSDYFNYQWSI